MTSIYVVIPAHPSCTVAFMRTSSEDAIKALLHHGMILNPVIPAIHPTMDALCFECHLTSKSMAPKAASVIRKHWPNARITMRTMKETEL